MTKGKRFTEKDLKKAAERVLETEAKVFDELAKY